MRRILCGLALVTTTANAATFDCGAARSEVEKMICASAELPALDEALQKTWSAALEGAPDAATLREEQREWQSTVRDACQSESCIEGAYVARIARLRLQSPHVFRHATPPKHIFGRYVKTTEECYGSDVPQARELAVARARERGEAPPDFRDGAAICVGEADTLVSVAPGEDNLAVVTIEVLISGGHSCSLEGKGEWRDGELYVAALDDASAEYDCVVRLRFSDDSVHLSDPGGRCEAVACGANASFDDATLPRVSTDPGTDSNPLPAAVREHERRRLRKE